MLSTQKQAAEIIQKSRNILIALPQNLNGDSLGSALALDATLKKLAKKSDLVCQESVPEKLKFLLGNENLKNKISSLRDFIISVDTNQRKISRLRYETEENILKIFLSSPEAIEEKDIKLESGPQKYDLIITLDAPDLESLGRIFGENAELFFNKPILNIDPKASNENFGAVNLVDPVAASCSQLVFELIQNLGQDLIDENSATALLCGLIVKTHSFQNSKTSPQALNLASILISQGGNQEEIIRYLYKTKPLNKVRLWGRILSQIDFNEEKNIAWLYASQEDFADTKTSQQDLSFVLEEIDECFPEIQTNFVLWTDETGFIWTIIQTKQPELLQKINLELGGTIKNDKLILSLNKTDQNLAKEQLRSLLNSWG